MASGQTVKLRFVRCPACREILPEPANVPVYQCGNCGKLLRAKNQKRDAPTSSGLHDADTAQNAMLGNVSAEQECSSSTHGGSLHSSGECSLHQNNGGNQLASANGNSEEVHAVRLPNEEKTDASDGDESKDDDQLGGLNLSNGNIKDDGAKHEFESPSNEKRRDVNLVNEDVNYGNDPSESSCCAIEQHGVRDVGSSTELASSENEELPQIAVADSETEVIDGSPLAGSEAQIHNKSKIDHDLRMSNSDVLIDEKGTRLSSSLAMHRTGRSISSDLPVSSANEDLEPTQENVQHDFNRVRSTDTFGTADFVNPSSELSGDLIDLSKSPITRSVRAYYDDGVSSCEGTDDQFPDRCVYTSKSPYKASNYAASEERLKREKFQANRSSELKHQFRNYAPYGSDKTRYAVKSNNLTSDELLEHTRPTNQDRNWGRLERDEYTSQLPFHQSGFQTGYQSSNISNPLREAFHYNSSLHSHDQPTYSEHEKIKLLRLFCELQDQLNKTCFMDEQPNGRSPAVDNWKDHHVPMYYGHEAIGEDFHNYSGYPGRFMEGSNWPQQGTYAHVPFQEAATTSRHQIDHSMCICPQDRRYSAQLTLTGRYRTNGFCKVHSGINLHGSYGSCPSSPQWHKDYEFPMYHRGTLSDDQRHGENAAKNYLREKKYSGKRHLRPVAGGAPFITCPCCFKQLQLPADFLLFERRCHRVQCGACSELLKFSLLDRIHLVPYRPSVKAPPPSEIDEYSEAVNIRHFAPAFHGRNSSPADGVSCSDDYGVSWSKSCSTNGDPASQINNTPLENRKKFGSGGLRKIYGTTGVYGSPGRPSGMSKGKEVSLESEELPAGRGSPLHRLMGYSSASDLIYNEGPSGSETY